MVNVHLDFESRSELVLKEVGTWRYSTHPSTEILCACYAIDDGRVETVTRDAILQLGGVGFHEYDDHCKSMYFPDMYPLYKLAQDPTVIFTAHNAFFEQCMWLNIMVKKYGMPMIPIHRWRCSAAKAQSHGLPKSLDACSEILCLDQLKDGEGKKIMLRMCKPRKATKADDSKWNESHEDFCKLYEYCRQDVRTEREIDATLPDLNPTEQVVWFVDQFMNANGTPVDMALVNKAIQFAIDYSEVLNNELSELTGGAVPRATMNARYKAWLATRGLNLPNTQEVTISEAFDNSANLPGDVRRSLEIKLLLSKSSVKKYEKFALTTSEDGRVRDLFIYHSASTGRWGGKHVQMQNLPRGVKGIDSDTCAECIVDLDLEGFKTIYPNVMGALSTCIRSSIKAEPGKVLMVADYSSIEARGIAWLAYHEKMLQTFRDGECAYCAAASQIYGHPCNEDDHPYERQVGKTAVLALGYQGGIAAFGTMANNYKLDLDPLYDIIWPTAADDEKYMAEKCYKMYHSKVEKPLSYGAGVASDIIKQRWRKANPEITGFWKQQEAGAIQAIQYKGTLVKAGRIFYQVIGDFLYCTLPSGRRLAYHHPELKVTETEWGTEKVQIRYMTLDSQTGRYGRTASYGGKLAENITQAVCRDIMAEAMIRTYNSGKYELLMTIHDEEVTQADPRFASVDGLCEIMCQIPTWCPDFPIVAKGWQGTRYKKN